MESARAVRHLSHHLNALLASAHLRISEALTHRPEPPREQSRASSWNTIHPQWSQTTRHCVLCHADHTHKKAGRRARGRIAAGAARPRTRRAVRSHAWRGRSLRPATALPAAADHLSVLFQCSRPFVGSASMHPPIGSCIHHCSHHLFMHPSTRPSFHAFTMKPSILYRSTCIHPSSPPSLCPFPVLSLFARPTGQLLLAEE